MQDTDRKQWDAIIIGSGIYVLRREENTGDKPIAYTGLTRR